MRLLLTDIPIPPSSNHIYSTDWKTKRRFKSKKYGKFELDFHRWLYTNTNQAADARQFMRTHFNPKKHSIRLDCYFCFPSDQIRAKAGHLKRLDVSNRIKVLHDVLADVLEVDDRYFNAGKVEKIEVKEGDTEMVIVELEIVRLKTIQELELELKIDVSKEKTNKEPKAFTVVSRNAVSDLLPKGRNSGSSRDDSGERW